MFTSRKTVKTQGNTVRQLSHDEIDTVAGGEGFFSAMFAFLRQEPIVLVPTIELPSQPEEVGIRTSWPPK